MSMLFKRIKDWATSITSFRTGDYIAVDGTSGTAKMPKDDLLQVTAQNAVDSGIAGSGSVQDNLVKQTLSGQTGGGTYNVTAGNGVYKSYTLSVAKGRHFKVVATPTNNCWDYGAIRVIATNTDDTTTTYGYYYSNYHGVLDLVALNDHKSLVVQILGANISASGTITIDITIPSIVSELSGFETELDTALSSIGDGYYNIPVVNSDAKHFRIVNGVWTAGSAYDTFIFPASEFVGGTAVIVGNGIVATNVAFLTSDSIVDGTSVSFVSGTGLTSYAKDKTLCLELPSGTNYVCVYIYRNNSSEPYFKIKSGFVLDFFASTKNQNVVGRKLNILEINLGGWAQGGGFATPTEQALDDLRQLCADCDVDILVPSESGNELIYRHFLNACFTQYWGRPANFSVYGVVPALRIPYATKYKDVYMRSVPGQVTLGSDRGSRCLELEYNGFKGILVPAHWIYDESSPIATLDARFDEWLNDIGYTDYDFCIIVGDTNVMWGSSTITQDHPSFTHIVDYFTAKHFFWVNGGKGNSIVAQYRDTPLSLTDYFIKQTYFGSNANQNYNIDQMLVWSKNNDLCVSVAYKVFTQAEMSSKYPNLYAAMGSSDHVPTIFKVNLN